MAPVSDASLTELDSFVGRESELIEARRQLQTNRLLTLTGPPGVGKTRLSRQLIAEQLPAFSDGVYVVDMIDVGQDDLYSTVASELEILDNSPVKLARLVEFVRTHQDMLLVLDNCEELIEGSRKLVSTLLQAAPRIRILTTSRVMLGTRGERLLPVPPLSRDHAVRLLIDRGSAVRPEWDRALRDQDQLPAEEIAAAREVCNLLDGVPLAIEMVAAWLDVLTVQELVAHLADRFKLLIAEDSDQPNHRSMRAALDSSYALLTPVAQRLWVVAATFAGGFDLPAAESLATAVEIDRQEVLTALTSLVRHSVLGTDTRDGRTRYTMLETLRVYARQRITDGGLKTRLHQAHADHFFDLVATANQRWFSPAEKSCIRELLAEVPNLRLALEWYRRHTEQTERAMLMTVMAINTRFQVSGGQLDEARRWGRAALERYPHYDELRVAALAQVAWLSLIQGVPEEEYASLLEQAEQCAQVAGCAHTSGPLVYAQATRVWLRVEQRGKARESIAMFERAEALFAAAGPGGPVHMAKLFAAFAACFLGDKAIATRKTKEVLDDAERSGAPWCIAWAHWTCALLELTHDGDLRMAFIWVQKALHAASVMRDTWLPAWGLWLQACIVAGMGQGDRAAYLFGAALQQQRRTRVFVEGLLPWFRVQQHAQSLARAALGGDEEFETQHALGQSARYETVMDLALLPPSWPDDATEGTDSGGAELGGLTPRESEVAGYVAREWKNRQIAAELGVSTKTIEVHVANVMRKWGVDTRVGIAVRVAQLRTPSATESS